MPSLLSLATFSGAAIVLLVVPGPAVLYILARSTSQGRRAGLVSVAGIHAGTAVHVLAALAGLSALVVASAAAFSTLKLAGAAYLIYLGIRALTRRHEAEVEPAAGSARSLGRIFADGVVLNVLNPKTALFFLAFVPQFVDVSAEHPALQILVLSGLFIGIGLVTDGCYALAGSWIGRRLRRSPAAARRADRAAGLSYLGLGAATALAGNGASRSS